MVSELVRADPFSHYSPKEQDPLSFTEIEKKKAQRKHHRLQQPEQMRQLLYLNLIFNTRP